jgi:Zn-dependent protease with chaperone function
MIEQGGLQALGRRLWQNTERASGAESIEFLSTHPSPGSRIERLRALMPQAFAVPGRRWNRQIGR